jgi:hypothetical protein
MKTIYNEGRVAVDNDYDTKQERGRHWNEYSGGKKMNDINICDGFVLQNVEVIENGYLAGYIQAMLLDEKKGKWYETLFRIHDTHNGDDYTLVSVDYGWRIGNDKIINMAEIKLKNFAKELDISFTKLENAQNEWMASEMKN